MTDRLTREKQLRDMITTSDGRAEIHRLARAIRGVKPDTPLNIFIGQMIEDILSVEFPVSPAANQQDGATSQATKTAQSSNVDSSSAYDAYPQDGQA